MNNSLRIPEILRPGDVVLTRGKGLKDFLIRWGQALARRRWRPSPFSHAALCSGPFTIIDANPGERVGRRSLKVWIQDIDLDKAVVFQRPCATARDEELVDEITGDIDNPKPKAQADPKTVFHALTYYSGRAYNWFFLIAKPDSTKRKDFFCSEYVMAVLSRLDPGVSFPKPESILPIDLSQFLEKAGWEKRALKDFFNLRLVGKGGESSDRPRPNLPEIFKETPDLSKIWEEVSSGLKEIDEMMIQGRKIAEKAAAREIESGSHVLQSVDLSVKLVAALEKRNYFFWEALRTAKDMDGIRSTLKEMGKEADLTMMAAILQTLIDRIALAKPGTGWFEPLDEIQERQSRLHAQNLVINQFLVAVFLAELRSAIEELEALRQRVVPELFDDGFPRMNDPRVLQIAKDFFDLRERHLGLARATESDADQFLLKLVECDKKLASKVGGKEIREDSNLLSEEVKLLKDLDRAKAGFFVGQIFSTGFLDIAGEGPTETAVLSEVAPTLMKLKDCGQILEQIKTMAG